MAKTGRPSRRPRTFAPIQAEDLATLDAALVKGKALHDLGVVLGHPAHVRVVRLERAVVVTPGRQRRTLDGGRVAKVLLVVLPHTLVQVGDADRPVEAGGTKRSLVGQAVQHDLDVVVPGVLGDVEADSGRGVDANSLKISLALPCRDDHLHQLARIGRLDVCGISLGRGRRRREQSYGQQQCQRRWNDSAAAQGGGVGHATLPVKQKNGRLKRAAAP